MRAQNSCFGFEAPATDGVFFALFPSEDAAAQLARTAQQLCIRHRLDGRVFAPERFHVSLLGFGAHAGLRRRCGRCYGRNRFRAVRSDLRSRRELSRPAAPARVVQRRRHSELIAFQRALGHSIQKRGLGRAKPQYTPHVTMLYDERAVEDHAIAPLRWTVRDFVLVHSRARPEPVQYPRALAPGRSAVAGKLI